MTDEKTLGVYSRDAAEFVARHHRAKSDLPERSKRAFPAGGRVLDVGTGGGRDLALLLTEGYDAWAVEPVAEMRAEALRLHPEVKGRLLPGALPDLASALAGNPDAARPFDGVLCSAVLQHLPLAALPDAIEGLRAVLAADGRALVVVPSQRSDLDEERLDPFGRYFSAIEPTTLTRLFGDAGFELQQRWEADRAHERYRIHWSTLLFALA